MQLRIEIPQGVQAGVFADFAAIWHTPDTFVLDFVASKSPAEQVVDPSTGTTDTVLDALTVARIRIPVSQCWEIAKALTQQLEAYEQEQKKHPDGSGPDQELPPAS